MKLPLLPYAFILLLSLPVLAQPYQQEQVTFLNDHGKETKEKKATILQQTVRRNDTLWEINIYRKNGPLLLSTQSRTADGSTLNGSYVTYLSDGWADTLGYFYKGMRQGNWMVFARNRVVQKIRYADGQVLWKKDSTQLKWERDSIRVVRKSEGKPMDSVESEYPGGAAAWLRYLNHTLRYPDEAVNNELMGTVVIGFNIDKQGSVPPVSIWIRRSAAYPLDKEASRVIYQSGAWTPAEQFGAKVNSSKLQPIVFRMEKIKTR